MLLAKSLPQKLRHKLGPLPEFADACCVAADDSAGDVAARRGHRALRARAS